MIEQRLQEIFETVYGTGAVTNTEGLIIEYIDELRETVNALCESFKPLEEWYDRTRKLSGLPPIIKEHVIRTKEKRRVGYNPPPLDTSPPKRVPSPPVPSRRLKPTYVEPVRCPKCNGKGFMRENDGAGNFFDVVCDCVETTEPARLTALEERKTLRAAAFGVRLKAVEEWMNRCRELAGLRLAPEPVESDPESVLMDMEQAAEDAAARARDGAEPAPDKADHGTEGPEGRTNEEIPVCRYTAPDKPDFSEIVEKHHNGPWRAYAFSGLVGEAIRRACEEAAEQATAELTRKGKELCEAHGNLLMEAHELKADFARLKAAAVPSVEEIGAWYRDWFKSGAPMRKHMRAWLKRRVEEAIAGKAGGEA